MKPTTKRTYRRRFDQATSGTPEHRETVPDGRHGLALINAACDRWLAARGLPREGGAR